MRAYVNFAALRIAEVRSDALGPLDTIAHPLDVGLYRGAVFRGDAHAGDFEIEVAEGGSGEQVEVDFVHFEQGGGTLQLTGLAPAGQKLYAVFHSSGEATGYHVSLRDGEKPDEQFDSEKLGKGDYFIFMPMKPGQYVIEGITKSTAKSGAKCALEVVEAKPGKAPRASSLGASLLLTDKGFDKKDLRIVSGDGVVVEIDTKGAVVVAQLKPEKRGGARYPDTPIRYPGRGIADKNSGGAARQKKHTK